MRIVICHYHIYKNSGTSFDVLLEKNFGSEHICFDGPFPFFRIDQEQLAAVINRRKGVKAFSSHQITLPVPVALDFHVLPVIFLRHPLLRVQSIYKFKRQSDDGTVTSENAQKMTFDEWLETCFADAQEITHISNAQTRMVGGAYGKKSLMRRSSAGMEYDVQQALRNLGCVQLLARTEFFNEDVGKFPAILREYAIDFQFEVSAPKNTTSNNHAKSIDERLEDLKQVISMKNFQRLVDANQQDIQLFNFIGERL